MLRWSLYPILIPRTALCAYLSPGGAYVRSWFSPLWNEDPKLIHNHFHILQRIQSEYGIINEDSYNINKTTFTLEIIVTAKFICSHNRWSKPSLIQPRNHEWVTTIKYISTKGFTLLPWITFKYGIKHASHLINQLHDHKIAGLQMKLTFFGLNRYLIS
jgi:hypothetical protein